MVGNAKNKRAQVLLCVSVSVLALQLSKNK